MLRAPQDLPCSTGINFLLFCEKTHLILPPFSGKSNIKNQKAK